MNKRFSKNKSQKIYSLKNRENQKETPEWSKREKDLRTQDVALRNRTYCNMSSSRGGSRGRQTGHATNVKIAD